MNAPKSFVVRLVRRVVAAVLIAGGVVGPSLAALPPQYQRARELAAVLDAAVPALGVIEAIERVGEDRFRVRSETCSVDAVVETLPDAPGAPPIVGPRRFRIVLDEPSCP